MLQDNVELVAFCDIDSELVRERFVILDIDFIIVDVPKDRHSYFPMKRPESVNFCFDIGVLVYTHDNLLLFQ